MDYYWNVFLLIHFQLVWVQGIGLCCSRLRVGYVYYLTCHIMYIKILNGNIGQKSRSSRLYETLTKFIRLNVRKLK